MVLSAVTIVAGGVTRASSTKHRDDGPFLGSAQATLDSIAPHAAGVFLGKIAAVSEHDERPTDGSLYDRFDIEILRSSGATLAAIVFVKAGGEFEFDIDDTLTADLQFRRSRARMAPRLTLKRDDLVVGKRYWFITSSWLDREEYPQGVASVWREDHCPFTSVLETAIREDAFRWHPLFFPESRFTVGWQDDVARRTSRVRAWRENRLLWEQRTQGLLTHALIEAWYVNRGWELADLRPPTLGDSAWVLLAESRADLGSKNRFGLPAGSWRIQQLFDMKSGSLISARVRNPEVGDVERVLQSYDSSGRLVYERIQDMLKRGGRSVGANTEDWLRRIERWYDPERGRLARQKVWRFAQVPVGQGLRSTWLAVDAKSGLAAGPAKVSARP